jgi:hypothetical protein
MVCRISTLLLKGTLLMLPLSAAPPRRMRPFLKAARLPVGVRHEVTGCRRWRLAQCPTAASRAHNWPLSGQ